MKKIIYTLISFIPLVVLAQTNQTQTIVSNINNNLGVVIQLLNGIIKIFFALGIVYFFWGVIKFIRASGNPKEAQEGKYIMVWGIVALTIMVSVYGLINWLSSILAIQNTNVNLPSSNLIQQGGGTQSLSF